MKVRMLVALGVSALLMAALVGKPKAGAQGPATPSEDNVELVGHIGGLFNDVKVAADRAYVAGTGLYILDVSSPTQPRLLGKLLLPDGSQGIDVIWPYAYLAGGYAGLRVVDVSDPASPREVGFFDTPDSAWGVAVAGSYAYVADHDAGLRIIDVRNPSAPSEVGFFDTPDSARGVAVAGSYAYVAGRYGGLRIIDVSNPLAPSEEGFYDTPGGAYGVAVVGSYAYVADSVGGLRIIDVSNPAAPSEAGFFDTGFAEGVAVVGSYAYVAAGYYGLRIIDVSNPSAPSEVGFYDTPGEARGVAGAGGYAYVADDEAGLRIINASNSATPSEVGFYDTPGDAYGVAVAGSYAYMASASSGLRIINVSNPAAPSEVGFYDSGGADGVTVAGSYAYVADFYAGLRIIDVRDPAAPSEVGFYNTPGWAEAVAVAGGYAYVASGSDGLRIIDVSNPAVPSEVGFYDTPGWAEAVTVAGGYAYVADVYSLRIIDVSNPAAPSEAGFFDTGFAEGVTVAAGYAYVAAYWKGLRIIDVRDPAAPSEVGFYDTPGYAEGVRVAAGYAYVADGDGGLRIIDVRDPAAPSEVGFYDTPGYAGAVAVAEGYAYVADYDAGLVILRYTGPDSTPTPSPTRTPTPSPTPSATHTQTSTPTRTNTLTATPTATSSTPTPSPGDPYEPDNTCADANAIVSNGDSQKHTLHIPGDADWLRFQATAGTYYIISALQVGNQAHPIIRLYDACEEDPFADSSDTFGFDQIITFRAERSGLYYLQLTHRDPNAYGDDTAYQVSVRPVTTGAAVIAGGRLYQNDDLQPQITFMSDRAYQTFRQAGYDHDDIFYMSADPSRPRFMDAPSSAVNLAFALQTWAPQHIQDGDPLFLYLTDHGENEFFFLDTGAQKVTPDDLDAWLLDFQNQRPNSPVVVIIEACRSGSFITPLGTISHPGRVIITATGENSDAYAKPPSQGGAYFSDALFNALAQNYDLWQSYEIGRQVVGEKWGGLQTPWIDGNGNGLPYPEDPDDEGAGRSLGLGSLTRLSGQAPFIEPPDLPLPAGDAPALIQVKVLDENPEGLTVWMEVTKPSTPPPSAPPGYITPVSHAQRVGLTYNPASGKFEVQFAFDEVGAYQFVFNAEDAGGQRAQAVSVNIMRTWDVYLPLVVRP